MKCADKMIQIGVYNNIIKKTFLNDLLKGEWMRGWCYITSFDSILYLYASKK